MRMLIIPVLVLTFLSPSEACFPPPPVCPNNKQSCIMDNNENVLQIKEVSNPLKCSEQLESNLNSSTKFFRAPVPIPAPETQSRPLFQIRCARITLKGDAHIGHIFPLGSHVATVKDNIFVSKDPVLRPQQLQRKGASGLTKRIQGG